MKNGKNEIGAPKLERGERVKFAAEGCLESGSRARWRMGEWTCTDRRIIFRQAGSVVLELSLEDIVSLCDEDRPFAFGKKTALAISYRGADAVDHTIWALGAELSACIKSMRAMAIQPVSEADVARVARELDERAETIVWYLWEHVHASIQELSIALGGADHAAILGAIRDDVNRVARDLLGYPLLLFEHCRADPIGGRDILYSWWIAGSRYSDVIVDDYCESFDEGPFYRVVAELRGLAMEDVSIDREEGALLFRNRENSRIIHEIDLPDDTMDTMEIKGVRNGMVEICIPKRGNS